MSRQTEEGLLVVIYINSHFCTAAPEKITGSMWEAVTASLLIHSLFMKNSNESNKTGNTAFNMSTKIILNHQTV